MGYNRHSLGLARRRSAGVTIIELIMVIIIIGVLAVPGAYLMSYFIQDSVFIPNQMNMDMLVMDAFTLMIEGDDQARGLRFSREITQIRRNRIDFINQDGDTIIYRLRVNQNRLTRSINGGSQVTFPYYTPSSGITLDRVNNRLFTYYDDNEATTNDPADVRRVAMTLIARTGSGSFDDWEGQAQQSSSVTVHRFQ